MRFARVLPAIALSVLLSEPLAARVVSYAPITSRQSIPAVQKRTNRHAVLLERVSVPYAGGGPICFGCFSTLSRLVVYDSQGLEEPRDVTPGGAPANLSAAAAYERDDGRLFLLANGNATLVPSDPPGLVRNFFSADGGATWTPISGPPSVPISTSSSVDVGGPFVRARRGSLRPGSPAVPFFLLAQRWNDGSGGSEIWIVRSDGSAHLLAVADWNARLLGTDIEGLAVLVSAVLPVPPGPGVTAQTPTAGIWRISPDGTQTLLAPLPQTDNPYVVADGWITPAGDAYVALEWNPYLPPGGGGLAGRRVVALASGGTLRELATSTSMDLTDLFAIPSANFSGAWILQRSSGPTVLSFHTGAGGLLEAWRDVTRPQVEALHAGASGTRLLVQVHRPRPQVDQRIFKDPALAIWEVGQPAPSAYDELFLNEQDLKGFVHLDVDAVDGGAPFLFDSGSWGLAFFPPGTGGPSGAGGGGDVVQEWGVVRASLRQRLVIPAAARSTGMFGAAWRTDLVLRNPDPEPVTVSVRLLPNADLVASVPDARVLVPASAVLSVPDVFLTLFALPSAAGALLLSPEGPRSIEATSRTYTASPGGGTYGMSVPAVDAFAALGTNFPVSFSAGLLGSAFRTNLVATDVSGRGASASLTLTGDSGAPDPLTGAISAPASGQRQVTDLAAALGAPPWRTGSLLLSPTGGESIAGLVAIDNVTNDPTWYPPDVPTTVVRTIPAVVHADGANGAKFRTDLFLFNPSERTQSLVLAVKPWGANTSETLLTLPLLPHESKTVRDVLSTAFSLSGVARLRFQTLGALDDSGGVRVTSRTYTVTPAGGTYGLLLPALNAFQSAGGGESLEVLLPAGGPGFRTNLALVDLSAAPGSGSTSVKVEVFDETGARRDVFETPVPLAGGVQIDDLFHGRGLGDGPRSGWIRVSPAGGLVAAYASVIDDATNDPIYAPAVLAAKP